LHIVAGIVAMGVAAVLGKVMGLNNTAIFTSSCVVYVAVSMWTESRIARRRSQLQGTLPVAAPAAGPQPNAHTAAGELPDQGQVPGEQVSRDQATRDQLTSEQRPRETRGGNAA
jgi:hypothetical protein